MFDLLHSSEIYQIALKIGQCRLRRTEANERRPRFLTNCKYKPGALQRIKVGGHLTVQCDP